MATRVLQRQRTRQLIVDAAAELMAGGNRDPSMEEIADRAQISRATAYRYFSTTADIIWQVLADRSIPAPEDVVLAAGEDLKECVAHVETVVNDFLFADPDGARAFERVSLERALGGSDRPKDRPRRRLRYIDEALDRYGDAVPPDRRELLRNALALTMGTHAVLTLLDVCDLEPAAAREVTQFAVRALVSEAQRPSAS